MSFVHPLVVGFLVALGVGLLVGIDRERHKGDGSTRHPAAGLRTFTLASLLGATAMAVGATTAIPRPRKSKSAERMTEITTTSTGPGIFRLKPRTVQSNANMTVPRISEGQ